MPPGYAPPPQAQPSRAASGIAAVALVLSLVGCFGFPIVNLVLFVLVLGKETSGTTFMVMLALGALTVLAAFVLGIVALARSNSSEAGGRVAAGAAIVFSLLSVVTAAAAVAAGILFAGGGGAHGRPLRVRGRAREAGVADGDEGWSAGSARPETEGLDAETRARLAEAWLADARMEHASVAAFSRLALDLMALGAPAALVEGAQRSALEEVGHARDCFALASAYAGRALGAGALPEAALGAGDASAAEKLRRVAVESAVDGCVGEGVAAALAREAAGAAWDPVVAGVLSRIAAEEQRHAELSGAVLAWCLREGGAAVERAVRDALRAAGGGRAAVAAGEPFALEAHGRIDPSRWGAARARACAELLARLDLDAARAA